MIDNFGQSHEKNTYIYLNYLAIKITKQYLYIKYAFIMRLTAMVHTG